MTRLGEKNAKKRSNVNYWHSRIPGIHGLWKLQIQPQKWRPLCKTKKYILGGKVFQSVTQNFRGNSYSYDSGGDMCLKVINVSNYLPSKMSLTNTHIRKWRF